MDRGEALEAYVDMHREEIEKQVHHEVARMQRSQEQDSWLYFADGCRVLISWDQYDDEQPPYFQVFAYPPDGDLDWAIRLNDYR